jgi:membrane protein implicated in regulation of membrane protease activity
MRRVLRWETPGHPPPKRPYRDSFLLHLAFAAIIVGVAWLTGGSLGRAIVFAAVFFVVATGWSWWKWRERLERERRAAEAATTAPPGKQQ